ncbi:glycine cleavage system H protein [Acidobacteriota bacterium]|nr:glycine cleavage system H protein [Acidobacteriota bacterium]
MSYPPNLKYTKDHEWIQMDDAQSLIGITQYAQEALGDVVFVDLPEVGSTFKSGGVFGTVESVKTVSDLFSPIDLEVTEVNAELKNHPEWVNEDPYGKAWMIKVKPLSTGSDLMSASEYEKLIASESH